MQIAVIGSFALSILHSILLFNQNPGISVLLFTIATTILVVFILNKHNKIKNSKALVLIIPILLLSSTYFIFHNELFNLLNIVVIIFLFVIMLIQLMKEKFELPYVFSKMVAILLGSLEFITEAFGCIKNSFYVTDEKKKEKKGIVKKIVKALCIALPLVLVVMLLLITADDAFAGIFKGITKGLLKLLNLQEISKLFCRILVIIILTIYFVCILFNLLEKDTSFQYLSENEQEKKKIKIDGFTVNTILTVLNLIYLIFSMVQLKSFATNQFTEIEQFSRSARQGFFQLMLVSFINFIVIIIASKNEQIQTTKSKTYGKIMNLFMIFFTFVILLVSFQRMYLYESNYGYTYLRLLVYYTLITEIILMLPTIFYVIKGKIQLAKSYFAILVVMYVILNFVNIDKFIAKENISRYLNGEKMDISYILNNTGIDAIPEIKKLYENKDNVIITEETKETNRSIENYLYSTQRKLIAEKPTWQSFNLSKNQAKKELEQMNLSYRTKEVKTNYGINNL